MADVVLTETLLSKLAGWEAMQEARRLLAEGRVLSSEWRPPQLIGQVRDGQSSLRAGLVIRSAIDADNLCPCRTSRQRGLICGHSVAVGLQVLQPAAPASAPSTLSPTTPPAPPRRPARALRRALHGEAGASLEVSVIFPAQLASALAQERVTLHFEGAWSKGRSPLALLPLDQPFAFAPEDAALLDGIERAAEGDTPGLLTLTPAALADLLPALVGHPRLSLGKKQPLVVRSSGEPLRLRASLADTGEIVLEPQPPLAEQILRGSTATWVLRHYELSPIDLPATLGDLALRPVRIPRRRVPQFLAGEWPHLVARCALDATFDPGCLELEPAVPRFRLRLTGGLAMLDGQLECRYGDRRVRPGVRETEEADWLEDPERPTRYQARDLPAERDAVAWLQRAGFSGPDPQGLWRMRGTDTVVGFFTRDYLRMERQWDIELDARLDQSTRQNFERIQPRFEILPSGEQWFDLGAVYESAGGERLDPAEIQRLLRSGHGRTRLQSGRWALLDTGAVEELEQVLVDANPRQQGGRYRIESTQAGFVDATLRRHPGWQVRAPAAWRERTAQTLGDRPLRCPSLGALEPVLRGYQKDGVAWLRFLRAHGFGGVLADDMGLGKTLQVLAHLEVLRTAGELQAPALVIAPTSLVFNWAAEAARWTPGLRVQTVQGPDRAQGFAALGSQHLVITSYALARRDAARYVGHEFDTVVLDEAQHIKNPGTQNAQAVKAIRSRHRLVLTGTPVENSVRDLWSLFDFLMPGYLGSARDFRERYEGPILQGKDATVRDRLARRLRPFVRRRLKRDVAPELPDRLEQVSYCPMTEAQRGAYRQVLDASRREILAAAGEERLPQNRMRVLTALLRLRQIACDLRLVQPDAMRDRADADSSAAAVPTSGKVELFHELLEEVIDGGHRVLVFSQFTTMLGLLRTELERREIACCYLDGETRDRAAVVERFQLEAGIPVFLISLKAGGTGLNLTGADTVIHFDPWWNPAVEAQATDRAHRIGQHRVVTSYKLVARDTVEEKILNLQARKGALARGLLGDEQSFAAALSWEDIQNLLSE